MELSGHRLLFECSAGSTACAGLALTNTGSTCLYYRWERIQPSHHRRHPANLFHLPDQAGAVLPGALHNFWYVQIILLFVKVRESFCTVGFLSTQMLWLTEKAVLTLNCHSSDVPLQSECSDDFPIASSSL